MADEKDKKQDEEGKDKEAAPAAAPAKSKKMLFIGIGAAVLLVVAIGVPVLMMTVGAKKEQQDEELGEGDAGAVPQGMIPEGSAVEDEVEEGEEVLGAIFPLETFVVNLSGGKFLRLQLQVEFNERDVPARFYTKLVPMRDAIISILTNRTPGDIDTAQGKESLKHDIKEAMNDALKREDVKTIYFTQFLVQ